MASALLALLLTGQSPAPFHDARWDAVNEAWSMCVLRHAAQDTRMPPYNAAQHGLRMCRSQEQAVRADWLRLMGPVDGPATRDRAMERLVDMMRDVAIGHVERARARDARR